jgi:hypothetical protein
VGRSQGQEFKFWLLFFVVDKLWMSLLGQNGDNNVYFVVLISG